GKRGEMSAPCAQAFQRHAGRFCSRLGARSLLGRRDHRRGAGALLRGVEALLEPIVARVTGQWIVQEPIERVVTLDALGHNVGCAPDIVTSFLAAFVRNGGEVRMSFLDCCLEVGHHDKLRVDATPDPPTGTSYVDESKRYRSVVSTKSGAIEAG